MASAEKRKQQTLLGSALLIFIFLSFIAVIFLAIQKYTEYSERLAMSNKIIESLLEHSTKQTRAYAEQLALMKQALKETQVSLGQVQSENSQLKDRMTELAKMELTIVNLQEENVRISQELARLKIAEENPQQLVMDLAQGREMIDSYRTKIYAISGRMHELKVDAQNQRIAALKEEDQQMLLLGNNGFLTRNGEPTPMDVVLPQKSPNVQVDVTFVK